MILRQLIFMAAFSLILPGAVSAQAYSGECGTCVERKQRMCSDECGLVPADKARRCQQRCIAEYCKHRCDKDAPELEAYITESCDDCLEQQFDACDPACAVGTPRKKAACKIRCSDERCQRPCSPR